MLYLVKVNYFITMPEGYRSGSTTLNECKTLEEVKEIIKKWKGFDRCPERDNYPPTEIKVFRAEEIIFKTIVKDIKIKQEIEKGDIEVSTEFIL